MRNTKMQEVTMELAVGSFVLFSFMLIALFAIFIGQNNIFTKSYEYEVYFPHVSGLVKGNAVHYRGIPSGQVNAMQVVETGEGVKVSISLEFPIKLHDDYEISIKTASALGGKWLVIDEGDLDLPEIASYDNLVGIAPLDIIEEATAMVKELRDSLTEEDFLNNLKDTVANINEISAKINEGEGTLAKLINDDTIYSDLEVISGNLKTVSDSLTRTNSTIGRLLNQDDTLIADLEVITANLRHVSEALTSTNSTVGRLIYEDDTLIKDLSEASENFAAFSKNLSGGEGTISKLIEDDELYNQVIELVTEARATLDDLRETSPITTFSSIFFGAF